ncbi:hypothetical protein UFOVP23_7 [uncultured Caudovirales phage]|uniref:Uncharacterized protein n=1 Tax=uncultured Caudovirales phage TaxID=2100421 RepID=A0A6J5TB76_9CAUD|nr:hypothetical protein UFOVP23_7 [uncultured Caudovirales phage]
MIGWVRSKLRPYYLDYGSVEKMKISQLIKLLESMQAKHGDLPVKYYNDGRSNYEANLTASHIDYLYEEDDNGEIVEDERRIFIG